MLTGSSSIKYRRRSVNTHVPVVSYDLRTSATKLNSAGFVAVLLNKNEQINRFLHETLYWFRAIPDFESKETDDVHTKLK